MGRSFCTKISVPCSRCRTWGNLYQVIRKWNQSPDFKDRWHMLPQEAILMNIDAWKVACVVIGVTETSSFRKLNWKLQIAGILKSTEYIWYLSSRLIHKVQQLLRQRKFYLGSSYGFYSNIWSVHINTCVSDFYYGIDLRGGVIFEALWMTLRTVHMKCQWPRQLQVFLTFCIVTYVLHPFSTSTWLWHWLLLYIASKLLILS